MQKPMVVGRPKAKAKTKPYSATSESIQVFKGIRTSLEGVVDVDKIDHIAAQLTHSALNAYYLRQNVEALIAIKSELDKIRNKI